MAGLSDDLAGTALLKLAPLGPAAAIATAAQFALGALGWGHQEPKVPLPDDPFAAFEPLWGVKRKPTDTRFSARVRVVDGVGAGTEFNVTMPRDAQGAPYALLRDPHAFIATHVAPPPAAVQHGQDGVYSGKPWAILAAEARRRGSPHRLRGGAVIVRQGHTTGAAALVIHGAAGPWQRWEILEVELAPAPEETGSVWLSQAPDLIANWTARHDAVHEPRFDYVDRRGWDKGAEDAWHAQVPLYSGGGPTESLAAWKAKATQLARDARHDWNARRLEQVAEDQAETAAWYTWRQALAAAGAQADADAELAAAFVGSAELLGELAPPELFAAQFQDLAQPPTPPTPLPTPVAAAVAVGGLLALLLL